MDTSSTGVFGAIAGNVASGLASFLGRRWVDAVQSGGRTDVYKRQFRFIVSPEDAYDLDLTDYVRDLMKRVESDLGRSLEWAAVNHRWDEPAPTGAPMTPAQNRKTDLPPAAETAGAPACSEAQVVARRLGAQGRSVVRNVGLDLGARHIAYCEVADGQVVERATFRSLAELERKVGPGTPDARCLLYTSRCV